MKFWSKLGWAPINNIYLYANTNPQRSKRKAGEINAHNFTNAPPYDKNNYQQEMEKSAKCKYQQYVCRGVRCKKLVRTYFIFSVGEWLCQSCYTDHVLSVDE